MEALIPLIAALIPPQEDAGRDRRRCTGNGGGEPYLHLFFFFLNIARTPLLVTYCNAGRIVNRVFSARVV